MERAYDMIASPEFAAGLLVRVHSQMIKDFLAGLPDVVKEKVEVLVEFDGLTKKMTLDEFKNTLFSTEVTVAEGTTAQPAPAYKAPLQALRMAGKKDEIFAGTKKITIRAGQRDYKEGKVMIGDEKECWCILKTITKVQWKSLKEVTKAEMIADGFKTPKSMLNGLKKFYSDMEFHMPVTVIEWE